MIEVEERFEIDRRAFYIKGTRTLHREGGPAIEWVGGKEEWWYNGKPHRDGGPAIVYEAIGLEEWYVNGVLHREDGPAIKYYDGRFLWLLEGKIYSKEEWFKALAEEQKEKMLYSEYFIRG